MMDKVNISFVRGAETPSLLPRDLNNFVEQAGLKYRFSVIQDTYVEGCPDMYFDESLWRRLVEFVVEFDPTATVSFTEHSRKPGGKEIPIDEFLNYFYKLSKDDRTPPPIIVARRDGLVELCMITEYWCDVGGPYPYHDSYTYSIFSDQDMSAEIPPFLAKASEHWNIASEILEAKR